MSVPVVGPHRLFVLVIVPASQIDQIGRPAVPAAVLLRLLLSSLPAALSAPQLLPLLLDQLPQLRLVRVPLGHGAALDRARPLASLGPYGLGPLLDQRRYDGGFRPHRARHVKGYPSSMIGPLYTLRVAFHQFVDDIPVGIVLEGVVEGDALEAVVFGGSVGMVREQRVNDLPAGSGTARDVEGKASESGFLRLDPLGKIDHEGLDHLRGRTEGARLMEGIDGRIVPSHEEARFLGELSREVWAHVARHGREGPILPQDELDEVLGRSKQTLPEGEVRDMIDPRGDPL
mmetsp:Transcript_27035/g.79896  ORF Transcript_27035/g.79896 Transcript_27035/m.79896 type:complete len:288 (+) Transcript_27035:233-1096(+)